VLTDEDGTIYIDNDQDMIITVNSQDYIIDDTTTPGVVYFTEKDISIDSFDAEWIMFGERYYKV